MNDASRLPNFDNCSFEDETIFVSREFGIFVSDVVARRREYRTILGKSLSVNFLLSG